MMISEKMKNQAKNALKELEEVVLHALYDIQDTSWSKKTEQITYNLSFIKPEDIEIIRSILNKLKAEGKVENLEGNEDAWRLKKQ